VPAPPSAQWVQSIALTPLAAAIFFDHRNFSICIRGKAIDTHNHRHAKGLNIFNMANQIAAAIAQRIRSSLSKSSLADTTVHF